MNLESLTRDFLGRKPRYRADRFAALMEHVPATGLDALAMTVSRRWRRNVFGTNERSKQPGVEGFQKLFFFKNRVGWFWGVTGIGYSYYGD